MANTLPGTTKNSPQDTGSTVPMVQSPLFLKFFLAFLALSIFPFLIAILFLVIGYESFITALLENGVFPVRTADDTPFVSIISNLRVQAALTVFFLVSLMFFGSVVLSKVFTGPIRALLRGVERVNQGDFSVEIPAVSHDETGQVAIRFNVMIKKLREIHEREELVSRAKNEFISIAAHQLRTPLAAIKWTIRMVLDRDTGPITPEQTSILQKGYDANERMIKLVSDLLDVTRIEEGRFGYVFEKHDIVAILAKVIDDFRPLAMERKIRLEVLVPPGKDLPQISVDAQRIGLVFSNLIANALNYTFAGGSVAVKVMQKEKELEIAVKDTGVGIPRSQMDRLFTKFFRGDNVVRLQTQGTGLGLFIVKNIVHGHGGKVRVESEEGKGSTFYVALPLAVNVLSKQGDAVLEEMLGGV